MIACEDVLNSSGMAAYQGDGGIGPGTLLQANRIIESGHLAAPCVACRQQRIARFHEPVAANPSQARFIKGWTNRAGAWSVLLAGRYHRLIPARHCRDDRRAVLRAGEHAYWSTLDTRAGAVRLPAWAAFPREEN